MKKTAYRVFLERMRYKIEGKAWEAVLNEDDPARFEQVKAICSKPQVQKRLELLGRLYGLECKLSKSPLDAWYAMLWSGQARVPAPYWAVRKFEIIGDARVHDPDSGTLDKIFGFRAGSRKTPEVKARLIMERMDGLFRHVWSLTLLGYDITSASRMVMRWYRQQVREKDQDMNYGGWKLGKGKDPAANLRKRYSAWRKANVRMIARAEPSMRTWLSTNREEFLKLFPTE